ncbi:MAG TPA: hypothetical protein VKV96_00990, partial [Roseiarcus sp.]|nr:hypothetical protein [Roseiarcus sp.]
GFKMERSRGEHSVGIGVEAGDAAGDHMRRIGGEKTAEVIANDDAHAAIIASQIRGQRLRLRLSQPGREMFGAQQRDIDARGIDLAKQRGQNVGAPVGREGNGKVSKLIMEIAASERRVIAPNASMIRKAARRVEDGGVAKLTLMIGAKPLERRRSSTFEADMEN